MKTTARTFPTIIAGTGESIQLVIEGTLDEYQENQVKLAIHRAKDFKANFIKDIKDYLIKNISQAPYIWEGYKMGSGGNHVWISDSANKRQAIIYVK